MTTSRSTTRGADAVARGRQLVRRRAEELGRPAAAEPAALVASELITNALLHGGGCQALDVRPTQDGVRIEVRDGNRNPPRVGIHSEVGLTGRGLRLVAALATRWGAEVEDGGKVVWAEVTGEEAAEPPQDEDLLLATWDDDRPPDGEQRHRVVLGDVPTDLLVEAKTHIEGVIREFTLAVEGARSGLTSEIPSHLVPLLTAVVEGFAEARAAIKQQALDAVRRGDTVTRLVLDLPADAAEAAERYALALDEVDAYCRARRLLTLETPPQHRVFRHWYVGEVAAQLRAAATGTEPPEPQPFERRLLAELDRVATAQRATDRAARLYTVAAALVSAATPRAVVDVVLNEGVAALGASGGGVLVTGSGDRLTLEGAVGYPDEVARQLRDEPADAELPAADALRTGVPVWLESRADRDARFPQLAALEASTVSLCAVPLEVQGRRLGALRFSFAEPRLFDDDERRFVLALAAETAEALDRAQLQDSLADLLAAQHRAEQALKRQHRLVEALGQVARAVTSQHDLRATVQQVTDAATSLTGAAFGGFLRAGDEGADGGADGGGDGQPFTVSSMPQEALAPLPLTTRLLGPALRGEGAVRLDDVTEDLRRGPRADRPGGPPPARSWLAVPVTGRDGEVIGALFLGHPEPGRFGPDEERLASALGAYAAVAFEHARLAEQAADR
jgi:GAF domain-containing protein/anti-sigma regulatory factor (Ser/Thr protein kinase)